MAGKLIWKIRILFLVIILGVFGINTNALAQSQSASPKQKIQLTFFDKILFKYIVAYYKASPEQKQELRKSFQQMISMLQQESKVSIQYLRLPEKEKINFKHPLGKVMDLTRPVTNANLKIQKNTADLADDDLSGNPLGFKNEIDPEIFLQVKKQFFRSPTPSYSIYSELYLEAFYPAPVVFSDSVIGNTVEIRTLLANQFNSNQREIRKFFRDIHWKLTGNPFYPDRLFDKEGWRQELNVLYQLNPKDVENFVVQISAEFKQYLNNFVGASAMSEMNPAVAKFIDKTFSFYFEHLSLDTKKLILSDWISNDFTRDPEKIIEIMIQNAGPHFQKLVQALVKEEGLPNRLKILFKKIESSVKPIPSVYAAEIIRPEMAQYNLTFLKDKPLGTGSMAQVHVGKYNDFYDVVIRFLKPEIEKRAQEDYSILLQLANEVDNDPVFTKLGVPKISYLVDDIHYSVTEELDLNKTYQNQMKARKIYHGKSFEFDDLKIKISVPWIMTYKNGSKILVQEKVSGGSLDTVYEKYKSEIPFLKRNVVEAIAKTWIEEVLYGSGFYHADPHQGNFLVSVSNKNNGSLVNVNLLDYGMSGQLSQFQQTSILKLGLGVDLKKLDLIVNNIWNLVKASSLNPLPNDLKSVYPDRFERTSSELPTALSAEKVSGVTKGEFRMMCARLIAESEKNNTELNIDDFIKLGIKLGIHFENSFLNLNRGLILLDKMLIESGSKQDIKSLGVMMALKHKTDVTKLILSEPLLSWDDIFKILKNSNQANKVNKNLNLKSEKIDGVAEKNLAVKNGNSPNIKNQKETHLEQKSENWNEESALDVTYRKTNQDMKIKNYNRQPVYLPTPPLSKNAENANYKSYVCSGIYK